MIAVSVLIRTTGRTAALKDALSCLRVQRLKDFEVVLVEDGPSTLEMFLGDFKDLPIVYEALGVRKGRSAAGNRAMTLAQGEYFLFLDEDDLLHPDHLQLLLQAARVNKRAIVYSWSQERRVDRLTNGAINMRGRFKRNRCETYSLLHLVAGNYIPINAVLFHRVLPERAGGFYEDIDYLEDGLLWLRFATLEPQWLCVPQITAIYHVPLSLRNRRRAFYQWHDKVHARMRTITATWNLEMLSQELEDNFNLSVLLRKAYYYIRSYL